MTWLENNVTKCVESVLIPNAINIGPIIWSPKCADTQIHMDRLNIFSTKPNFLCREILIWNFIRNCKNIFWDHYNTVEWGYLNLEGLLELNRKKRFKPLLGLKYWTCGRDSTFSQQVAVLAGRKRRNTAFYSFLQFLIEVMLEPCKNVSFCDLQTSTSTLVLTTYTRKVITIPHNKYVI